MQLYTGLPVITNKITQEEQQGIPHHLLGHIGLDEQTWVVGTFVKRALGVIDDIRSRGKMPILVGGTHYYTQSLLFQGGLEDEETEDNRTAAHDIAQRWPILQESNDVLLEKLRSVDPVMANRWHPKDRRKIQRSLEIYLRTGRKASDVYAEQREIGEAGDGNGAAGQSMRYPTLLLWVHAEQEELRARLDSRVLKMLETGLLDEVNTLYGFANASSAKIDETRGIWVSIGYKEFKAYMQACKDGQASDEQLDKLKSEAIERTQIATRQYAKRQLRWIRIKLINALSRADAGDQLYLLDGTDISSFDDRVVRPALELTQTFLFASHPMPKPSSLSDVAADMLTAKRDYDLAATPSQWVRNHCQLCGTTCVTNEQWQMHVKSRTHRRLVAKANKVPTSSGQEHVDAP
jgi:tRNA dimethylallyltransferase